LSQSNTRIHSVKRFGTYAHSRQSPGKGEQASEIWLRRQGNQFFAVRVDWMGHSAHASFAHCHFEAFPADRRFDYEHPPKKMPQEGWVPVTKFDTKTRLRARILITFA
jgi:hypothetical protein